MAGIVAYCLSDNKPSLSLIHVNSLDQGVIAYPELGLNSVCDESKGKNTGRDCLEPAPAIPA